jgi:hypothetical protein
MVKLPLLILIPLALLVLPGIAIVDVSENAPGGNHIVVPVPMVLAQVVVPFMPHDLRSVDAPRDLERWLPVLERCATELGDQPDFVLAEVTTPEEHLVLRKAGGELLLDLQERSGAEVHCRVPLQSVSRVVEACRDGRLGASEIAHVLWSLPSGDLGSVSEGGERVRVGIWKL